MRLIALLFTAVAGFSDVSSAAAPAVEGFARLDEFDEVTISPRGTHVAITAPAGDETGLAVIRLADRKIVAAIKLGQYQHVTSATWIGPERLALTVAEKKADLEAPRPVGGLIAVNADGSQMTILTSEYAEWLVDPLPEDPDHVIMGAIPDWARTWEGPTMRAEMVNSYDNRRSARVYAPTGGFGDLLADSSGEVRYAIIPDRGNKPIAYWRLKDSGEWRRAPLSSRVEASVAALRFSADGQSVYLRAPAPGGSDRLCLVRHELKDDAVTPILCDEQSDVAGVWFSGEQGEPVLAAFESGRPRIAFVPDQHNGQAIFEALHAQFASRGEVVVPVSASLDGDRIVLQAFSDRNPGDYYLFDRTTGRAEFLLSRRGWIDPRQSAERRPIVFDARDGHRIHAYLTLPPKAPARRLPLVVLPHGGPFWVRDHWQWDADAQFLASRGYAVLQINFRGSSGYGSDHVESARQGWGTVMIDDITDGLRWTLNEGYADPQRVCIYGASYGGYAAVMSAVRHPDLYRCVVTYVGVYDFAAMKWESYSYGHSRLSNFFKDYVGKSLKLAREQSPRSHIDRLRAPVLIAHGEQDEVVPIEHAIKLRKDLEERKIPYEWLVKENEGHGFYKLENRIELYQALERFLATHLPAEAQPKGPSR